MFNDYFGAIISGRLTRLRFAGLWLLLIVVFIGLGLAAAASIGIAEHLVGGDLTTAQRILRQNLAVPFIIIVVVVGLLILFANLNIIAKRARDAGLPGWIAAIVIAALSGGVPQLTGSSGSGGGLGVLLLLVLAFLPTGTFKR